MSTIEYALAYTAQGWAVLPLDPGQKRPHKRLAPTGFKGATRDVKQIAAWFAEDPSAGLGIVPWPAGTLVLDIDVKNGQRGLETLAALEAIHGELPPTLTARTPSGGEHRVYRCNVPFGNRKLGDGIDVRCADGYIACEPTTIDGNAYQWLDWDVTTGEIPEIADAPAWLVEQLSGANDGAVNGTLVQTPRTAIEPSQVTHLRSALNALDPDDYELWIRMGMALHGLGSTGRDLWITWSMQSAKFDPAEAGQKWASFHPNSTDYRAVFAEAQRRGWVNPMSIAATTSGRPGVNGETAGSHVEPLDLRELAATRPEGVRFKLDGWMPEGAVTLLTSHGGVGKSFIAGVDLAVCLAAGIPWFGIETKRSRVAVFSAEDDKRVIHTRLHRVCRKYGLDLAELDGWLFTYDMTTVDTELYGEADRDRAGRTLPRYEWLESEVERRSIDVLIIDNASDTFSGNEINRAQVRAFIRSLAKLVHARCGAVLLLTHVNKESAKPGGGDEDYSGSTAWPNSARSRWSLRPDQNEEIVLWHKKTNWGKKADPITIRWDDETHTFVPVSQGTPNPAVELMEHHSRMTVLLMFDEFERRGENISTGHTSPANPYKMFKGERNFPRNLGRDTVQAMVRDLERAQLIERREIRTADRKTKEVWRITDAGRAECGAPPAPVAPTAPTAPTAVDGADGAPVRTAAPSAPTGAGGVGGSARTRRRTTRRAQAPAGSPP